MPVFLRSWNSLLFHCADAMAMGRHAQGQLYRPRLFSFRARYPNVLGVLETDHDTYQFQRVGD